MWQNADTVFQKVVTEGKFIIFKHVIPYEMNKNKMKKFTFSEVNFYSVVQVLDPQGNFRTMGLTF